MIFKTTIVIDIISTLTKDPKDNMESIEDFMDRLDRGEVKPDFEGDFPDGFGRD